MQGGFVRSELEETVSTLVILRGGENRISLVQCALTEMHLIVGFILMRVTDSRLN